MTLATQRRFAGAGASANTLLLWSAPRCNRWTSPSVAWFVDTLHRAVDRAQHALDAVLARTRFLQRWATTPLLGRKPCTTLRHGRRPILVVYNPVPNVQKEDYVCGPDDATALEAQGQHIEFHR